MGDAPVTGPGDAGVDAPSEVGEGAPPAAPMDATVEADAELEDGCVKGTCADFDTMYTANGVRTLCGKTPDRCGGVISCAAACAYGVCTDNYLGADVCTCERRSNMDAMCSGKPPKAVRCQTNEVPPGCTGLGGAVWCCP